MSAEEELRWLGIQGRHLVTLLTVADEGTFAGAAVKLGYTQSTISHQVATLERLVGERLVERGPGAGSVRLTRAGEVMLAHAGAIMARLGAARADLAVAREALEEGVLRLGVLPSIGTSVLPHVVAGLAREFPRVELEIHENEPRSDLQALVARGEIDLAFALGPLRHESLQHVEIRRERFLLLLPGADGGTNARRLERLVAPRPCPVQERVEQVLRARGMCPRDIVRVDDLAVIEALVASGSMAGLVPGAPRVAAGITVVDVDESLVRTIFAFWHGDRLLAPPARRAVELARSVGEAVDSPAAAAAAVTAAVHAPE